MSSKKRSFTLSKATVAAISVAIATSCSHSGYKDFGFFKSKSTPSNRKIASEDDVIRTTADFSLFYDPNSKFVSSQKIFQGSPDLKVQVRLVHNDNVSCRMGAEEGTHEGSVHIFNPQSGDEIYCENTSTNMEEVVKAEFLVAKQVPNWDEVDSKHEVMVNALKSVKNAEYTPEVVALAKELNGGQPTVIKIEPKKFDFKNQKVVLGSFTKADYLEFVKADGKVGQNKQELASKPVGPEGRTYMLKRGVINWKTKEEGVIPHQYGPLTREAPGILYCVSKAGEKSKDSVIYLGNQAGIIATPFDGDVECKFNLTWGITTYVGELQLYYYALNHKTIIADLEGLIKKSEGKMDELIQVRDKANSDALNALVQGFVKDNNSYATNARTEIKAQALAKEQVEQAKRDADIEIDKAKQQADADIQRAKDEEAEKTKELKEDKKAAERALKKETDKYFPSEIIGNYTRAYHKVSIHPVVESKTFKTKVGGEVIEQTMTYVKMVIESPTSRYIVADASHGYFDANEKLLGVDYIVTKTDGLSDAKMAELTNTFYLCPGDVGHVGKDLKTAQNESWTAKQVFDTIRLAAQGAPKKCDSVKNKNKVQIVFKRVDSFEFVYRKHKKELKLQEDLPAMDCLSFAPYRIRASYVNDKLNLEMLRFIDGNVRSDEQIAKLQDQYDDMEENVKETLIYADRRMKQYAKAAKHDFFKHLVPTTVLWKNASDVNEYKVIKTSTLFPKKDSEGFVIGK